MTQPTHAAAPQPKVYAATISRAGATVRIFPQRPLDDFLRYEYIAATGSGQPNRTGTISASTPVNPDDLGYAIALLLQGAEAAKP